MPKLEQVQQPPGRHARRGRTARVSSSLAEINVVPLVDVMLVLLVIFMVTAPMMQQGLNVHLPQSRRSAPVHAPLTVTVPLSFRTDRRVRIGKEWVPLDVLDVRAKEELDGQIDKNVIVAGDGGITLSETMEVADKLQAAGVDKLAIQTQPSTAGRVP